MLRAYLWGIETCNFVKKNCISWFVASLPMRNWNAQEKSNPHGTGLGCEPTYEELKLLAIRQTFLPKKRCEPTYEELKPVNVRYLGFLGRSCEPTYEELKLGRIDLSLWELRKLRAYLWGIETPFLLYVEYSTIISCEPTYEELKLEPLNEREGVVKSLRAYLWGIETFISYSFWGISP